MLVFLTFRMVVVVALHALYDFFLLGGVAECFKQIYNYHILVCRFPERVLYPLIRLPACIDENVAHRNFHYIIRRRLIAVKIDTAVEQHRNIGIVELVTENIFHPIIFGKYRGDDLQLARFLIVPLRLPRFGAARRKASDNHKSGDQS